MGIEVDLLENLLKAFARSQFPDLVEQCRLHAEGVGSTDPECCLAIMVCGWLTANYEHHGEGKDSIMDGVMMIAQERARQVSVEKYTAEHDDEHTDGALAQAAACYAIQDEIFTKDVCGEPIPIWPFDEEYDKRLVHPRFRQLAIAGALIAAEIDRLKRQITQRDE